MRLLIDTSVLIDALRRRYGRRELLTELVRDGHILATSAINVAEVFAGMRPGEEAETEALLDLLDCHEITEDTGRIAGRLRNSWARKGKTLTLADTVVAAIALGKSCVLMTDNIKHFPMKELELYLLPSKQ